MKNEETQADGKKVTPGSASSTIDRNADALDIRWLVKAFFAILLFVCTVLWGVYVPVMTKLSEKSMAAGDAYRDRALFLKTNAAVQAKDVEQLDLKINRIYQLVAAFFEWSRSGQASVDPNDRLNRKIVQSVKEMDPEIRTLDDFVLNMIKGDHLEDTFAFLLVKFKNRSNNLEGRLDVTVGQPLDADHDNEKYYSGLCYNALPDLLTSAKKIHDLYVTNACFDRAMEEYIDAIGYSRLWTKPRLRMADLYRDRGWPEFAMAEYLRVIKLDPAGPDGHQAFQQIQKYSGQHVEADFNIALAYLVLGDNANAQKSLRNFVHLAPTNVNAPKASEILRYVETSRNNKDNAEIFIQQYLRDEIWI